MKEVLSGGYEKITMDKSGQVRWKKDGRFVKAEVVPEEIKSPKPPAPRREYLPAGIEISEEDDGYDDSVVLKTPPTKPMVEIDDTGILGQDTREQDKPLIFREPVSLEDEAEYARIQKHLNSLDSRCFFCENYGSHKKTVGIKKRRYEVNICEDHYFEKTLGQIVQAINKIKEQ